MELDARGIVPRPWQSWLTALIVRLVLHALNDDGAPDGISIPRALATVFGAKRLMGFEPTTLCMASSTLAYGRWLKCLQIRGFVAKWGARLLNEYGSSRGGLETEWTLRKPALGRWLDAARGRGAGRACPLAPTLAGVEVAPT
jgi:hypothetical protein